jgi:multidrug transporter EmrE-like cation transporter
MSAHEELEFEPSMRQGELQSAVLVADEPGIYPAEVQSPLLRQWWVAFGASAVFVVSGHLLIKAGLNGITPSAANASVIARLINVLLQPEVAVGLMIYMMGTVCWMRAVSQKEISFLYPLSSLNYVLVAAASSLFFHEVIGVRRAGGVLLVVLGMILMNRQSGAKR